MVNLQKANRVYLARRCKGKHIIANELKTRIQLSQYCFADCCCPYYECMYIQTSERQEQKRTIPLVSGSAVCLSKRQSHKREVTVRCSVYFSLLRARNNETKQTDAAGPILATTIYRKNPSFKSMLLGGSPLTPAAQPAVWEAEIEKCKVERQTKSKTFPS